MAVDSLAWRGRYSSLPRCLSSGEFDVVLFGLEREHASKLGRMVKFMRQARVRTFVQADQYPVLVGEVRPARLYGHPLVEVRSELLSLAEQALKRMTDIAMSLGLLVLTLPVWIVLAILIPLDSSGPIFYIQRRVGQGGKEFTLLKFRSMFHDAEAKTGAVLAQERDPRVTRIGRFLRSTRSDELPQLLNVLRGQMSLVGPRPERREFVERFVREIPLYERRLNVKPGLTGWSQVHLKYDSRADQIPIKLKYDFYYIENMSLPLDMKILFMTLFVILRGEGL
jgi:exopolysaccharide biosynthesis polyprenyl glycosylphosphotransferase